MCLLGCICRYGQSHFPHPHTQEPVIKFGWLLNIYSSKIVIINNTVNTLFSETIVSVFGEDVSVASRAPIKKRILTQLASK